MVGVFRFAGKNGGFTAYTGYDYLSMLTGQSNRAVRYQVIGSKPGMTADEQNKLAQAIEARLSRSARQAKREFKPDFSSAKPLLKLGLTPRATEALLWLAQGKTNSDIATILGITESTVKKHVQEIFEKLGVETRGAAAVRALEVLNAGGSSIP